LDEHLYKPLIKMGDSEPGSSEPPPKVSKQL